MFSVSMFWPGMVLNQGQLSIVVSDWESYLGSLFLFCLCGKFVVALVNFAVVFVISCFVGDILTNKRKMYAHDAAPWSHYDDGVKPDGMAYCCRMLW